jgi:uncharacterized protein with PIN domain
VEALKTEQARLLAEQSRPFPKQMELDLARAQAAAYWQEAMRESKEGTRFFGLVRSRASVGKEHEARLKAQEAATRLSELEQEKSSREAQIAARLRDIGYDLAPAGVALNKAMREARRSEGERRKRAREFEEKQIIAARLAAAERASRDLARSVRATIPKGDRCPYCDGRLVESECDHIVPVAKGGLSTPSNMVHVCKPCNQAKGEMTLFQFCRARGFEFLQVVARLERAGKVV